MRNLIYFDDTEDEYKFKSGFICAQHDRMWIQCSPFPLPYNTIIEGIYNNWVSYHGKYIRTLV